MEGFNEGVRLPLSPVKPNTTGKHGRAGRKELGHWQGPPTKNLEAFRQIAAANRPLKSQTRIPAPSPAASAQKRLTPSTGSRIPRAGQATPESQLYITLGTRIPRPISAEFAARGKQATERPLPPGFQAYCNPSFDGAAEVAQAATAGPAATERTFGAWCEDASSTVQSDARRVERTTPPGAAGELPTPDALQILHHINRRTPGAQPEGVRDIMNAFLRTGPQALSPETNYDYGIPAPKPAALKARGIMNFSAPGGVGVLGAVQEYLRTGAHLLSPEPGHEADAASVAVPAPRMAVVAAPRHRKTAIPTPLPHPDATPARAECSVGELVPSSVCSNAPAPEPEAARPEAPAPAPTQQPEAPRAQLQIQLAAPVDSVSDGDSGMPTARLWAGGARELAAVVAAAEPSPDEPPSRPPSRVVSPVAFNLSSSPDSEVGTEQHSGSRNAGATQHASSSESAASFSFGMRVAATAEGAAGDAVQELAASPADLEQEEAEEEQLLRRVPSDETVEQLTPYVSMMQHLRSTGPAAYASPASRRHAALAGPPASHALASPLCDSPQSPQQCTPLQLLPEGVPPSATPELGKGNLHAWIDRRGMRGVLTSPAVADLERLWGAMRERQGARSEAEAAAAANAALRAELERLGEERDAAVGAAEAGQAWAEAEVSRAREAAQHMMALADQIQATFALCEEEKATLAAELDAARERVEQAEAQAEEHAALAAARGQEETEREREAAAALREEVQAAQAAARQAQRDAEATQEAAQAAARELAMIQAQLEQAHAQLAAAADDAPQLPAAATPVSKLRVQLHGMHEALAALHAAGHARGEDPAGANRHSPALDRLLAASGAQLERAEHLLSADAVQLHSENEALREKVAAARERLAQASPDPVQRGGGPHAAPDAGPMSVRLEDDPSFSGSEQTVTVDFVDLQHAVGATSIDQGHLGTDSSAMAASTHHRQHSGGGGGCSAVVDGVKVTNVPPSQVSLVRAMVDYFEAMAAGEEEEAAAAAAAVADAASHEEGMAGQAFISEEGHAEQAQREVYLEVAEVEVELEEMMGEAVEAALVGPPLSSPAGSDCLATALPEGLAVTPAAGRTSDGGGPPASAPPAPTCAPADDRTPPAQRNHSAAVARMAWHRSPAPHDPSVAEAATPESSELSCFEFIVSPPVTPLDMSALTQDRGCGMKEAVRARLQRLKADLQAAQARLHHVDEGLAAIATPPSAPRPSAPSPAPPAASAAAIRPAPAPLAAPLVDAEATPAGPAASVPAVCRTRPSVRWADSVRDNSGGRGGALRPGTPVASVAAAASPPPTVTGSTTRGADRTPTAAADSARRGPPGSALQSAARSGTLQRRINLDSEDDDSDSGGELGIIGSPSSDAASRLARRLGSSNLFALPPTPAVSGDGEHTPRSTLRYRPALFSPQASQFSSTSSFTPPESVALLAIRPLAGRRVRRGGGAGGRRASESDDKEFRRRAAALRIHVSPYFKRGGGGRARREEDGGEMRAVS